MIQKDDQISPLKVALYVRVSTEDQGERYGLDMQKEALIHLIKSKGQLKNGKNAWELADNKYIYVDEISGTTDPDERSGFSRLKEDIQEAPDGLRPFDIVAVYKIDRFARKLKILLDIIEFFEQNGIEFISANENIDTSTAFGRAIVSIIGVIAELERETIKQRTHDGRMQAVKKGVVMGSYAPFGYAKDENKLLKIEEREKETVEEIFNLFVNQKLSPYQIAKELTARNIFSPEASAIASGKKKGEIRKRTSSDFWRTESIVKILQQEVYVGKIYYNKGERGKTYPKEQRILSEAHSPLIIDPLTFEKAQRLIETTRHERKETVSGHTYLLSGLLRCDACYQNSDDAGRIHWVGTRKEVEKGSGRFRYSYRCGRKNDSKHEVTCNALPLPAEEIERYVLDFSKKLIKDPKAAYKYQLQLKSSRKAEALLRKKHAYLTGILNGLPTRRERVRDMRERDEMSQEELEKRFEKIAAIEKKTKNDLVETEREMANNVLSQGYVTALNAFSDKYKVSLEKIFSNRAETYTILHELIEEIVVYSRPLTKEDKIAGKRKKDQQIPSRLHIKLKLPQDILHDLTRGFAVGKSHLSG